jgi:hypothetical protein
VYYWHAGCEFDHEVVLHEKPDVVIQELTERYLMVKTPMNSENLKATRKRSSNKGAPASLKRAGPSRGASGD